MAVTKVRVELIEQRGGLWCATCQQPSRTHYTLSVTDGERLALTQREKCRFAHPDPGETHE